MAGNNSGRKNIRAFIAVALPQNIKDALKTLQQRLRDFGIDMKYTRPENIHLTLKFLGDIRGEDVAPISDCLAAAVSDVEAFSLNAGGLGVFPSVRRPRVLWTGLGGETEVLGRMQHSIEDSLSALGFEKENKRFVGHLTLGRFKQRVKPERVVSAIEQFGNTATDAFAVDAVHLYQSTLTPKGPIYRVLFSQRLEGE